MKNLGLIYVVDDDDEMRNMMSEFLTKQGYKVEAFPLATKAFEAIQLRKEAGDMDELSLIVSDIQMPEMNGMEFTERCKKVDPELPVILVTAFGSIESAIEATRIGAYDYIVKPFKLTELGVRCSRAVHFRQLQKENQILRDEVQKGWSFGSMIGKSKGMKGVFDMIDQVSGATANVLINGESGTGKELVARAIHEKGPRASKPFVAINCTAIPETLLESELFGHAKGSFTGAVGNKKGLFEEAEGGTLFLDEIGDLDLSLQAKLLRVLQEKKIKPVGSNQYRDINVRIIAATHKDLQKAIKDHLFREDLYYRLSVIPIQIPSLRHRKDDIPLLANFFLEKYAPTNNPKVKSFTTEALQKLMSAQWNGNVRELENIVERVVVLAKSEMIEAGEIPVSGEEGIDDFYTHTVQALPTIEDLEKKYIKYVLDKTGGRKEKASQILGINRRTLYRKEREYGFVSESSNGNETH